MAFLEQFSSYFSEIDKTTELYALWSSIGVNTEKTFLEEQNRLNAEFTDINNFSENTLRSWLAFFLQKIPYRFTAKTQVTVSITNDNARRTVINKYDRLKSNTGYYYVLWEELSLSPGDVRTVTAVQGKRVTETGTYNSIIKFHANNPDLNYLEVKLNGQEIPPVSFETSYDRLSYRGSWKPQNETGKSWGGTPFLEDATTSTKGIFYNVIADGMTKFSENGIPVEFKTGDVVCFDGKNWVKSLENNNILPIQFANNMTIPRNGYYAYYYNGYLFIKIFPGSEVLDPNDCTYEVNYIQSDGIQGEVKENSLQFVSNYTDIDGNIVTFDITNSASTGATNEPTINQLISYLKQRLFCSISISTVPEYTAWFKAQPEVGDCLVLSDYEKYLRAGKNQLNITATGAVTVYLVDPNGNPLSVETQDMLLERLEPYKDIAIITISEFIPVYQHLEFEYTSSTNDLSFEKYVTTAASQFYNLNFLQAIKTSLFEDLDLTMILKVILQSSPYDSTGLTLRGYHYTEKSISSANKKLIINSYNYEKHGDGWYVVEGVDDDNNPVKYEFTELENLDDSTACFIYDKTNSEIAVGNHVNDVVSIDLTPYPIKEGTIKCYWGMENKGILSIGLDNGLRKLQSISIKKVG